MTIMLLGRGGRHDVGGPIPCRVRIRHNERRQMNEKRQEEGTHQSAHDILREEGASPRP